MNTNHYHWKLWKHRTVYLKDGSPYIERWKLDLWLFSVRVHKFYASDDGRAFHDHPWWFWTLILKGRYYDVTPDGEQLCTAGRLYYRPTGHKHYVRMYRPETPTWTLVLTGKHRHRWGFYRDGKFFNSKRYFMKWGASLMRTYTIDSKGPVEDPQGNWVKYSEAITYLTENNLLWARVSEAARALDRYSSDDALGEDFLVQALKQVAHGVSK